MFEVGKALSSTWQALHASLLSTRHDDTKRTKQRTAPRRARTRTLVIDEQHGDEFAPAAISLSPREERASSAGFVRRPALVRPAFIRPALVCFAMCVAGAAYLAMQDERLAGQARSVLPERDAIAGPLGLGIDQVALAGHRYTFDGDVFDALDLGNVRSFLSFDAKSAKARIERLPWIATAELTRVYPGRLDVRVTERKAFAIWTRGDRQYLIDETGRTLSAIGGSSLPDLPHVAGEGAATEAKALLDLLAGFPDVAKRLAKAERVGERRWNLNLHDGITLKLPADGEARVLAELASNDDLRRLASTANSIIDFRAPGRAAVRPADQPPAASDTPGKATGS
ncbi:MAG: cell division protein FtsQ/DivIB [Hyphomicrobium sp.]